MHYYKRNIGDYHKKAGRLTMLQHGAFTLLMDSCYDRERFPTRDEAVEWLWASSKEEIEAVEFVLCRFFELEDGVYVQKRIKYELANYHKNAETNKRIAIERETKRREKRTKRAQSVNGANTLKHEAPPNQEPLTTNQEPIELPMSSGDDAPKVKQIPYEKIKEIYNKNLPTLTNSRVLSNKSKRQIAAIWKQKDEHQTSRFWTAYFSGCGQLSGKMENWTGASTGNKCGTIELLTREEIFVRNLNEILDSGIWSS